MCPGGFLSCYIKTLIVHSIQLNIYPSSSSSLSFISRAEQRFSFLSKMVRAPCCEKMGLKKGPWTTEEDQILINYIHLHGHGNWRALPKQAGTFPSLLFFKLSGVCLCWNLKLTFLNFFSLSLIRPVKVWKKLQTSLD